MLSAIYKIMRAVYSIHNGDHALSYYFLSFVYSYTIYGRRDLFFIS